jgi:hypothetical protein
MPDVELKMPLWAQIALAAWSLGCVTLFLRQILVAVAER